jgi:hypothetical protein
MTVTVQVDAWLATNIDLAYVKPVRIGFCSGP